MWEYIEYSGKSSSSASVFVLAEEKTHWRKLLPHPLTRLLRQPRVAQRRETLPSFLPFTPSLPPSLLPLYSSLTFSSSPSILPALPSSHLLLFPCISFLYFALARVLFLSFSLYLSIYLSIFLSIYYLFIYPSITNEAIFFLSIIILVFVY